MICIALMYRVDNDILFEELKMNEKNYIKDDNSCATVLLKDSINLTIIIYIR
jgi:hypothetical protein